MSAIPHHPLDGYTVMRATVRVLRPTTGSRGHGEDQGHDGVGSSSSFVQPIEICFHPDFDPLPYGQPFSVHLSSSGVSWYSEAVELNRPTPPNYICELGLIDLFPDAPASPGSLGPPVPTASAAAAASPPSPSSPSSPSFRSASFSPSPSPPPTTAPHPPGAGFRPALAAVSWSRRQILSALLLGAITTFNAFCMLYYAFAFPAWPWQCSSPYPYRKPEVVSTVTQTLHLPEQLIAIEADQVHLCCELYRDLDQSLAGDEVKRIEPVIEDIFELSLEACAQVRRVFRHLLGNSRRDPWPNLNVDLVHNKISRTTVDARTEWSTIQSQLIAHWAEFPVTGLEELATAIEDWASPPSCFSLSERELSTLTRLHL